MVKIEHCPVTRHWVNDENFSCTLFKRIIRRWRPKPLHSVCILNCKANKNNFHRADKKRMSGMVRGLRFGQNINYRKQTITALRLKNEKHSFNWISLPEEAIVLRSYDRLAYVQSCYVTIKQFLGQVATPKSVVFFKSARDGPWQTYHRKLILNIVFISQSASHGTLLVALYVTVIWTVNSKPVSRNRARKKDPKAYITQLNWSLGVLLSLSIRHSWLSSSSVFVHLLNG